MKSLIKVIEDLILYIGSATRILDNSKKNLTISDKIKNIKFEFQITIVSTWVSWFDPFTPTGPQDPQITDPYRTTCGGNFIPISWKRLVLFFKLLISLSDDFGNLQIFFAPVNFDLLIAATVAFNVFLLVIWATDKICLFYRNKRPGREKEEFTILGELS